MEAYDSPFWTTKAFDSVPVIAPLLKPIEVAFPNAP